MTATPDEVRPAIAARVGAEPADLLVEVPEPEVPGLTPFAAHSGRRSWAGVVDGASGEVVLDAEDAIARVLRAWGYGEERTLEVDEVVEVVGLLEGRPGAPVIFEGQLEDGDREAGIGLPEELEVDGRPAIGFWNTTPRRPAYRVVVVVQPDGGVEVRS